MTDEDNAQYMCVAVNNGGRAVSKAELYVLERGKISSYIMINLFNSLFISNKICLENIKRPDMLLKLTASSSYKSLDTYKFIDNDNKYFAMTKSSDSFENKSSRSSTDVNTQKQQRTETPSTVSYELLNDTYYEQNDKYIHEPEVVLKSISNIDVPATLGTPKAISVVLNHQNHKNDFESPRNISDHGKLIEIKEKLY